LKEKLNVEGGVSGEKGGRTGHERDLPATLGGKESAFCVPRREKGRIGGLCLVMGKKGEGPSRDGRRITDGYRNHNTTRNEEKKEE